MSRERQRRSSKREVILHYAMKVFALNGYGATTYDMVAEQAGVTRSLIIKYYGSKENLAARALDAFIEEYAYRISQIAIKEESFRDFSEKTAKLLKRWKLEIGFIIGLMVTPAHAHLADKARDALAQAMSRHDAEVSPFVQQQMTALHITFAVDGDEGAYDAGREMLLDYSGKTI